MIFLSDAAGVITAAIPEAINQGSIGVNRIVLIAPFPSNAVVSATFTLPNGIKIYPRYVGETPEDNYAYLMGVVEAFGDKGLTIDGVTVNAWQLTLDKAITQVAGNVTVQFLVTTAVGTTVQGDGDITITDIVPGSAATLTTTSATLPINRGNAYISPSVDPTQFELIQQYLAAANVAAQAAEDSASEAEGFASEAEGWYENAKDEADRAKEQADRASPWDIVITQDNVLAVLNTLAAAQYKSILFFGVDFTSLNLERFIVNGRATFNFPATAEKVEFRGCQIDNVPLVLVGNGECNIIGASDRLLKISTFGGVENCTASEILGCDHVSNCTATIIDDCNNVTGCTATQMNNCAKVSASKANAFSGCTYVDPYSVEGRVAVGSEAVGQAAVLTPNGTFVTAPLASRLVLSVSSADYKVTATLYDRTGGIMSTATIDLPLESVVVGATVSEDGTKLILTLQNGTTVDVPISDIFRGLATEEWVKENTIVKLESEYDEQVYLQDAEGNVTLHKVDYTASANSIVRRNSSRDILLKPTVSNDLAAVSKGQMEAYVNNAVKPYDVVTQRVDLNYNATFLKLTIANLLDGNYASFQPFDLVCVGSDGMPMSSICTMFVEQYDSVRMLVYDSKHQSPPLYPIYYLSEEGNVYLYFNTNGEYIQVFIRGLVEKCTGATLEIIDALPDGVLDIDIERHAIVGESSGGANIDVTAEVGQTIIVKEVDANGKPTKWEAASYQEKICGMGYGILVPDTTVTILMGTGLYDVSLPLVPSVGKTYTVNWRGFSDGVYTCTAVALPFLGEGAVGFGNIMGEGWADMPFLFVSGNTGAPITKLITSDSISDKDATFSISGEVPEKIPTKYIPTLEEMRSTVVLPETTVEIPTDGDFAGIGVLPAITLVDGATYTVNYNGVEYICICASYAGMIGVGNFGAVNENFPNNNEPFVLGLADGAYIVVPLDGSATVTVSITRTVPIPTGYLTNALPFYIEATADKAVDDNNGPTNYMFTTPAKDLAKAYNEGREIKLRLRITETAGPLTYNLVTKAVNGIYFFVVPFSDFGNMNMPAYMFFGAVDEFLQIIESSDGTLVRYSD